jgi:hypothetical protein
MNKFWIGFGVACSLAFMWLPEMLGYGGREALPPMSRSLPAPDRIPRVSDEEDARISREKVYHPPDRWKWIIQDAGGCPPNPWIPCPPIYFERPEFPAPDFEEEEPEQPRQDRTIVAMHRDTHQGMKGPYGGPKR